MSDQPSYDPELVAAFQDQYTQTIILNSLTALVAFEYFITLGQEISLMWRRHLNGASILFFLNRYLLVLSVILVYVPFSEKVSVCPGIMRFVEAVGLAQLAVYALFSALRIYALWGRNLPLFALVVLLGLVPVGTNLYDYVIAQPEYFWDPIFGAFCSLPIQDTKVFNLEFPVATRACLVAADVFVVVLTWAKTFRTYKDSTTYGIRAPLLVLFFRDGTVYFVALLFMNIAHILLQTLSVMQSLTPATVFFATLTPILISRFLLNLRQIDPSSQATEAGNQSQFTDPGFRVPSNILTGNLGQPLEHVDTDFGESERYEKDEFSVHPTSLGERTLGLSETMTSGSTPSPV